MFNYVQESFHSLIEHSSESAHKCSTETEKDDCHLFIVHHVKSHNCNGNHDHFLKKDKKCFKCDSYKEKQNQFLQGDITSFLSAQINNDLSILDQHNLSFYSFHRFLRGPPVRV
ncbi:MAG: hypothetical protein ACXVC7_05090 [Bacteroidia bacterium]